MGLDFVGVDPDNPDDACPAVFVDPETGDFYFQGETVNAPGVLAWINSDSRILDTESVVRLPARMASIILEAVNGSYERGRRRFPAGGHPRPDEDVRTGEKEPTFAELLGACASSAVHLEIHDVHRTSDSAYQAWLAGRAELQESAEQYRAYTDVVVPAVRRGVRVRRARIVSEPVSDYVRWEHWLTERVNIAAGEDVRWLPRRLASTLAVPGNPYWVFDGRMVRFTIFGGDGEVQGSQYSDDAGVTEACQSAFEAVWQLAIPHQEFRI